MFSSVRKKNLNWKILKHGMGLGSLNNLTFKRGGGFRKNQYVGENGLTRGLGKFADLRRGLGIKDGVVFLRVGRGW